MKFCKNCRYFEPSEAVPSLGGCSRPELAFTKQSLVTGEVETLGPPAGFMRNRGFGEGDERCGPEAKYYEERSDEP